MTNLRKQGDLRDKNIDFPSFSGRNKELFLQLNLWSPVNSHQLLCHNEVIFVLKNGKKINNKKKMHVKEKDEVSKFLKIFKSLRESYDKENVQIASPFYFFKL